MFMCTIDFQSLQKNTNGAHQLFGYRQRNAYRFGTIWEY